MISRFSSCVLAVAWVTALLTSGCTLPEKKTETIASEDPIPPPAFVVEHGQPFENRSVRVARTIYRGPIFDTHIHLAPPRHGVIVRSQLRTIIETLEDADVEGGVFMPAPNEGRFPHHPVGVRQRRLLAVLGIGTIKLFCGSDYISVWLHEAYRRGYDPAELETILQRLADDIDSGMFRGVGEIGLYHFKKQPHQETIAYPPNFAPFLKILDLVAAKGVWLDLHAEPIDPDGKSYEDILFGGLELWYRRHPDLKLILSHTAMTNPTNARRILETYPHVMMNIKFENDDMWKKLGPIINRHRQLYEDWAVLFEEMPERFMIGTDEGSGAGEFSPRRYQKGIKQIRRTLLGAIHTRAAKKIAYGNARKLFR